MSETQNCGDADDLHAEERLAFLRLEQDTRQHLQALRPTVSTILPALLDALYSHMQRSPELEKILGNEDNVRRLKEGQRRHWDALFTGNFDAGYFGRTSAVGRAHHAIGLEPRWYSGAYCFLLEGLIEAQLPRHRKSRQASEAIKALLRAVFLDMDLVLSTYIRTLGSSRLKVEMLHLADMLEREIEIGVGAISAEAVRMTEGAETLATISTRLHETATTVEASATSAIGNVQSVAGATEELEASSRQIAHQVGETRRLTEAAVDQAIAADETVQGLSGAVARINEVVTLVGAIAAQTKLLALNATIEAARAGEAGAGFGVVAAEVKSLARQTEDAIHTIRSQSEAIGSAARQAIAMVQRVTQDIRSINGVAEHVAQATEHQRSATGEISVNAGSAAEQVQSVGTHAMAVLQESGATGETAKRVKIISKQVSLSIQDLQRRMTTILRASYAGDRRGGPRYPMAVKCRLKIGNEEFDSWTFDLSVGGALVNNKLTQVSEGARATLHLDRIGTIEATIVAITKLGLHLQFEGLTAETKAAITARVAEEQKADQPTVARTQEIAARIARTFESALKSGRITPENLFSSRYTPIADTNPQQYHAPFTDLCDATLPVIIDPPLAVDQRIAFCAAVDLNAYLPTHNKKYSHAQRRGDYEWNLANCRNRRIFDDRTGILAARNQDPWLVQIYPRVLSGSDVVILKEIDAPISIGGKIWGNVRLAMTL